MDLAELRGNLLIRRKHLSNPGRICKQRLPVIRRDLDERPLGKERVSQHFQHPCLGIH